MRRLAVIAALLASAAVPASAGASPYLLPHRRVRMVVYNQGSYYAPLLRLRPRSAAELRRQLRRRRFAR